MDVKAISASGSGPSGASRTKKPNFIIQENISFNRGKIVSTSTPKSGTPAASVKATSKTQSNLSKKDLVLGMKNSLSMKIAKAPTKVVPLTKKQRKLQKLKAMASKPIAKAPENVPPEVKAEKTVQTSKAVPSTSGTKEINGELPPVAVTRGKAITSMNMLQNTWMSSNTGVKCNTAVDFEDIIPSVTTSKQELREYALTSEVTLIRTNPKNKMLPKESADEKATISRAKSAQTPRITLEKVGVPGKKKLKKKKRRFRNMEGSEDEDDWPMVAQPIPVTTPKVSNLNITSESTTSPASGSKPKEKIQILQSYIFPSPNNRKKPETPKAETLEVEREADGHVSDDSVSSIHSKMSAISDFNLNGSFGSIGHGESLVEESVVVEEVAVDVEESASEALEAQGAVVLQVEGNDEEGGEIFCAYDDDGNLVCLQKGANGELIMLPTEQVNQEDLINGDNNNSFEVESKEKQVIDYDVQEKQKEEELLMSSPEHTETCGDGLDEELLLHGDVKEVEVEAEVGVGVEVEENQVLREASPGILPETVENIGNEEIIADSSTTEEEVVTLPTGDTVETNSEPIYILNDPEQAEANDLVNISGATPLEMAFLQSLAQSATTISVAMSPESQPNAAIEVKATQEEVVLAPIATDLETLLQVQEQCRIVDYKPSDQSDQYNLDESISSVNELSQMDIAKMILGEGLGARLVSDQAEAVDLLQLPPNYQPKPVVLQPVAPSIVDKMAVQVQERPKRQYKKKQPWDATSTPLQKVIKKKKMNKRQKALQMQVMMMNHVTGDSDFASPAPVGVSTPFKSTQKIKIAKNTNSPKVTKSPPTPVSSIKSSLKRKLNGVLNASNVLEDSTSNSNLLNINSKLTSIGGDSELKSVSTTLDSSQSDVPALAFTDSQSESSIILSANNSKTKKKKRRSNKWSIKKRVRVPSQKMNAEITEISGIVNTPATETADANNSSKENDSHLDGNSSLFQDGVSSIDGSIVDEVKTDYESEAIETAESATENSKTDQSSQSSQEMINPRDDSLNEHISLGDDTEATSSQDSTDFEEHRKVKTKKAKKKKKKKHSDIDDTTKSSLPAGISQVNLANAEVSISITEGVQEDKADSVILSEEEIKQEPLDDAADSAATPAVDQVANKSTEQKSDEPLTANGAAESIRSTPRSVKKVITKFPFKINFKNLIAPNATDVSTTPSPSKSAKAKHKHKKSTKNKTPPQDFRFEEVKIKDELPDATGEEPRVPKIILKLSPHTAPSIVRSPASAEKTLSATPQSKANVKKRKVFSPLARVESPVAKKSKNSESVEFAVENTPQDVANTSQPLFTDDPELVINLPITGQEKNEAEQQTTVGNAQVQENDFQVKLECDDDEMPDEVDPYHVGDLVLARLGTFCFWPCMINREPDQQKYRRFTGKKVLWYHVRFFGDNGRRAWVPKVSIIKYDGPDTLEKHDVYLRDRKKRCKVIEIRGIGREIAACKVSNRMKKTWLIGMAEEAALVDKTVAERHQFFFEMFASRQEKAVAVKRKRMNTETSEASDAVKEDVEEIEVKDEPAVNAEYDKPPEKKRRVESKKPSGSSESGSGLGSSITPKGIKKMKKPEAVTPNNIERRSSIRSSTSGKVPESPKDDPVVVGSTNEQKRNYVIEDLELIIKGSLIMNDEELGLKVEEKTPEKEKEVARKRKPPKRHSSDEKKLDKVDLKSLKSKVMNDAASEISDTDSSSKISVQSTGNKRVLFKDIPRTPVCHACFKTGGVVLKCKGNCFGFYHPECSQLKEEPKEEEEIPVFGNGTGSPSTPTCTPPKVEIVSVKTKTKYFDRDAVNLNQSDACGSLDLIDQLDSKLSKVMAPIAATTNYYGSTTDTSLDESACELVQVIDSEENVTDFEVKVKKAEEDQANQADFMCINCKHALEPPCFSCGSTVYLLKHVERFRCSVNGCGKYFHKECLKCWPQATVNVNDQTFSFKCPMHICQTCTSENPTASTSLLPLSKSVRCVKCPGTYHMNSFCIPAGTEILSQTHIICPRHVQHNKLKRYTINANWCFICSRGGDLLCCETCPTSVHSDCISINLRADDSFVCEECESGRLPLYDEIVWAKFAQYKWWPAVILFPEDVPGRVKKIPHKNGEFVVRFYGTHDHHWFALGRVFLFQEDDRGDANHSRKDLNFLKAVAEAKAALVCKKQLKLQRDLARRKSEKPPPFTRIRINRMVGNLKPYDGNVSSTNACNCNAEMTTPCGVYSDCLNRLLMTECDPEVCPARDKCQNQRFEKRLYPPLVPYKTESRGWGLKSTEPLLKGQFIIEYVGEVIDQEEYHRRIAKMNEQKAENYYFLTLDGNRTIDAGPKGNVARFMNHCCKPNCETQKWNVRGDTRVGLFALADIPADTELTFNYNMETINDQKKVCRCGAENCSGFLGAKNKEIMKLKTKSKPKPKPKKAVKMAEPEGISPSMPCFICGERDADLDCTMRNCSKVYHVKCLEIYSKPQGKWTCPRHYCNECAKKTIRSCVSCLESYCPMHAHGKITFLKTIGYACNKHNPDLTSLSAVADDTSMLPPVKDSPVL